MILKSYLSLVHVSALALFVGALSNPTNAQVEAAVAASEAVISMALEANEAARTRAWQNKVNEKLNRIIAQGEEIIRILNKLPEMLNDANYNQTRLETTVHMHSLIGTLNNHIIGKRSVRKARVEDDSSKIQTQLRDLMAYYPAERRLVLYARPTQEMAYAGALALVGAYSIAPDKKGKKDILEYTIAQFESWNNPARKGSPAEAVVYQQPIVDAVKRSLESRIGKNKNLGSYSANITIRSRTQGPIAVSCTADILANVVIDIDKSYVSIGGIHSSEPCGHLDVEKVAASRTQLIKEQLVAYHAKLKDLDARKEDQKILETMVKILKKLN